MSDFNPQGLVPSNGPQAPTPIRQISHNVQATGFDDDTVRKYDFDLYKGRLNETDRIYILNPRDLIKTRFHFHDKVKFVRCNSEYKQTGQQELLVREAQCCKLLGKSDTRFGVLILRYITNKTGTLLMPFQVPEMRLWKISIDKYLALRDINNSFPLHTVDLSVTCTEVQYQKMTIGAQPPQNCIFTMKDFPAALKDQILQWVSASLPKLPGEMGKVMSDEDILKELGQAGAAAPVMTQADVPMSSINFDDLVGAAGQTAQPPKSS